MTTTWSSGIFSCCDDCSSCCYTCCCSCCQYGENAEKIESGTCCLMGTIYCFFSPCMVCYQRGLVRSKYGIEGTAFNDCLCSFFCGACALCQITREINGK